jgi:hypothetical protein
MDLHPVVMNGSLGNWIIR